MKHSHVRPVIVALFGIFAVLLPYITGNLYYRHVATIMGVIRDSGIGVLLVEHHTDCVFRICDRVTALNLGRMIAHGTTIQVGNDPDVIRVYPGA